MVAWATSLEGYILHAIMFIDGGVNGHGAYSQALVMDFFHFLRGWEKLFKTESHHEGKEIAMDFLGA